MGDLVFILVLALGVTAVVLVSNMEDMKDKRQSQESADYAVSSVPTSDASVQCFILTMTNDKRSIGFSCVAVTP